MFAPKRLIAGFQMRKVWRREQIAAEITTRVSGVLILDHTDWIKVYDAVNDYLREGGKL